MRLSIIIPCYNEFLTITEIVKRVKAIDVKNIQIIIVDDASNDGTKDVTPAKLREPVLKFLRKHNARIQNVISKESDETALKQAGVDAVPAILVYGKDGKLAKRFDVDAAGGKDPTYAKHVIPFVKKLLAK